MNSSKIAAASLLIAFSAHSLAAKPTSIAFQASGQDSEGRPYSAYEVKCSDGKRLPLTAWDNRRKWCVGEVASTRCEKKQIRAAKAACQG